MIKTHWFYSSCKTVTTTQCFNSDHNAKARTTNKLVNRNLNILVSSNLNREFLHERVTKIVNLPIAVIHFVLH